MKKELCQKQDIQRKEGKLSKMYELLGQERERFLKHAYMDSEPREVQDLLSAFASHFEAIKKSTLEVKCQQNWANEDTFGLVR